MLLPALLDFFVLVLIQLEPSVWRLANRHWIKITAISESYFNHTLTTLLKQECLAIASGQAVWQTAKAILWSEFGQWLTVIIHTVTYMFHVT